MDKIIPLIADCFAQAFGAHKCDWLTNENVRRVTEKMDFSLM
jgi:acyl-CoA oxidase